MFGCNTNMPAGWRAQRVFVMSRAVQAPPDIGFDCRAESDVPSHNRGQVTRTADSTKPLQGDIHEAVAG